MDQHASQSSIFIRFTHLVVDISSLQKEAIAKIKGASSSEELSAIEKEYFGRKKGTLTDAMKELKDCSPDEKKKKGQELNALKEKVIGVLKERQASLEDSSLDALAQSDDIDLSMDLPASERGHLHLVPEFIRQIEDVFGRMGFDVAYGPEVDTEEYNFDLLNFPKDHASRDWADIFYMRSGGKPENRRLLRGHTSTVQIHYMQNHKPPFRMICPGVTYRKDADATHSPMFAQFEGLMIDRNISLRHMKGIMEEAVKELITPDLNFRFRTGYFPFVEPGLEMDIQWQGEEETKEGKWLEVVGCGMVHPNVLRNVNIDPDKWQGFAFGFGVERLLMIRHQIPNIRLFYQGDLRFLRQF